MAVPTPIIRRTVGSRGVSILLSQLHPLWGSFVITRKETMLAVMFTRLELKNADSQ